VDEVRTTVSDALDSGVAVRFTYTRPDGDPIPRTVDPIRILAIDGQWYLRGWCHLRQAVRTFHLDRVSDLVVTDIPAGNHDDVETSLLSGPGGEVAVRIRFQNHVAPLLGQYLDHAEVESGDAESSATVYVADTRSLRRLAARRGGAVVVESPPQAREAAVAWAAAGLAQYAD